MLPPPPALREDDVWAAIDRERLGLADLLAGLTADEWERASLCRGWRVRDVAAHLALAHLRGLPVLVAALRAGGSFDRMVRDTARRHARVPTSQLVGELRAMAGSRRRVVGLTPLEPLLDVLVHGQDIRIPLDRPQAMPVDAAATAASRAWTTGWPLSRAFSVRARMRGLHLVATDTAWEAGAGARVEGPIEALLLLLTGRTAALDRLTGEGAERLARLRDASPR